MFFYLLPPREEKIKGDTEAARALNYSRRISLYEFSRAHIVRPAELVQKKSVGSNWALGPPLYPPWIFNPPFSAQFLMSFVSSVFLEFSCFCFWFYFWFVDDDFDDDVADDDGDHVVAVVGDVDDDCVGGDGVFGEYVDCFDCA